MSIIYTGTVQEIHDELEVVKPVLDRQYQKIFGPKLAAQIKRSAENLLVPESMHDSIYSFNAAGSADLKPDHSTTFGVYMQPFIDFSRTSGHQRIQSAPIFYVSHEAFQNSGYSNYTDRLIASYVHEFHHFIWYALQNTPMQVAGIALREEADGEVFDLFEQFIETGETESNLISRMQSAHNAQTLIEFNEKATRTLDKMVLGSIGIEVDYKWRNEPREFVQLKADSTGNIYPIPTGKGDPYMKMSDEEIIHANLDWYNFLMGRVSGQQAFKDLLNFLEYNVDVRKVPVTSMVIEEE